MVLRNICCYQMNGCIRFIGMSQTKSIQLHQIVNYCDSTNFEQFLINCIWTDGARTKDDAIVTVHLMIFFHLQNIEHMLDCSHDPAKEMMNVVAADVMDMTSQKHFEHFKSHVDEFSDADNYKQTMKRMDEIGYAVIKIAFRGYSTTTTLQDMHNNAIEERTALKLNYEQEQQSQELEDMRQLREMQRVERKRGDDMIQMQHEIDTQATQLQAEIQQNQQKQVEILDKNEKLFEQDLTFKRETEAMNLEYKKKGINATNGA
eukprot:127798_1